MTACQDVSQKAVDFTCYTTCRKESVCTSQSDLAGKRWPTFLETKLAAEIFELCLTEDGYGDLIKRELWQDFFERCLKPAVTEVWRAGRLWEMQHTKTPKIPKEF